MPRLGQHFLKNPSVLKKIVGALHGASNIIVEIGPGHGELTQAILGEMSKNGGSNKLIALEKDPALAEAFRKRFLNGAPLHENPEARSATTVELVEGDALVTLKTLAAGNESSSWMLVGNIPYYITGKLFRVISELPHKPERAVFLIQEEVAERICAAPPEMNRLAASVQFWASPAIVARVPKEDFSPQPKINSAVIALATKHSDPTVDARCYYETVRALFSQPRKTIFNNIAAHNANSRETIETLLKKVGVSPSLRPQNLTIEEIAAIALALFKKI